MCTITMYIDTVYTITMISLPLYHYRYIITMDTITVDAITMDTVTMYTVKTRTNQIGDYDTYGIAAGFMMYTITIYLYPWALPLDCGGY